MMLHTPRSLPFHPSHPPENLADLARGLFHAIGEDPAREGLLRTPERYQKALRELTAGYALTPAQVVGEGIFPAEGAGLVAVKDIELYSLCEHHLLPFWGRATIAYYPKERILGLSKLARVLEVFARRLQVQERLTREVGEALRSLVDARAVAVRIDAQHMCMMMRGVRSQGASTTTEFTAGLDSLTELERSRILQSIEP